MAPPKPLPMTTASSNGFCELTFPSVLLILKPESRQPDQNHAWIGLGTQDFKRNAAGPKARGPLDLNSSASGLAGARRFHYPSGHLLPSKVRIVCRRQRIQ